MTYFKVWGASPSDVWIVGDRGVVLHSDGARRRPHARPRARRRTVHDRPRLRTPTTSTSWAAAAAAWRRTSTAPPSACSRSPTLPILSGVACDGGTATVGGFFAYAARLDHDGGAPRPLPMPSELADLGIHGVAARAGRVFAVGGDLARERPTSQRGFAVELRD